MDVKYFIKQNNPTTVRFQTLENGKLLNWIDLSTFVSQFPDERMFLNHFKVRFFCGNNQFEFVTYSSIDGWYLSTFLTVLWKNLQSSAAKNPSNSTLHELTGMLKSEIEDTWYLTWK